MLSLGSNAPITGSLGNSRPDGLFPAGGKTSTAKRRHAVKGGASQHQAKRPFTALVPKWSKLSRHLEENTAMRKEKSIDFTRDKNKVHRTLGPFRSNYSTESYQDAGADFFIYAGQRWLDRTFEILKSYANFYGAIAIGTNYLLVPECRLVKGVRVIYSNGHVDRLKPLSLERLYHCCHSGCSPHFYAPCSVRTQPELSGQLTAPSGSIVMQDNFPYNAVVFDMPIY